MAALRAIASMFRSKKPEPKPDPKPKPGPGPKPKPKPGPPKPPAPAPATPRVLFLLKIRGYNGSAGPASNGLLNSAMYVADMLDEEGVETSLVQVVDANSIDREVYLFKPTHVIVEALWAPPAKFLELRRLHPGVVWIVRVHSEIPFLAQEGVSVQWVLEYIAAGVRVAFNSLNAWATFAALAPRGEGQAALLLYLPNYFPVIKAPPIRTGLLTPGELNVGCFGAIRLMKNQLIQAMAATIFAPTIGCRLRFHMSVSFHAGDGGEAALKNIQALFAANPGNELVLHGWGTHAQFLGLLTWTDFGMQMSLTETFDIIAAETVNLGLPIVASPEVSWLSPKAQARATSTGEIVDAMMRAWHGRREIGAENLDRLDDFSDDAEAIWLRFLGARKDDGGRR